MPERTQDAERPAAFHAAPVEAAFDQLSASPDGLSEAEARKRLDTYGPNTAPSAARSLLIVQFLRHFHNALIYVLIAAAAVTWWLGHPVDTIVIAFVVLANAVIGFVQEGRAEAAMEATETLLSPHAAVYRDSNRSTIDAGVWPPGG